MFEEHHAGLQCSKRRQGVADRIRFFCHFRKHDHLHSIKNGCSRNKTKETVKRRAKLPNKTNTIVQIINKRTNALMNTVIFSLLFYEYVDRDDVKRTFAPL